MHSLTPARLEVVRDLDHFAATEARACGSRAFRKAPGCFHVTGLRGVPAPPPPRRAPPALARAAPAALTRHARVRSWWTC
jgi:hypothetical protein